LQSQQRPLRIAAEESTHVQTEDVLVDARGYIYITHKNQGLWILRHTPK
jgi:hypothetical protein